MYINVTGHNVGKTLDDIENIKKFFPGPVTHHVKTDQAVWQKRYQVSKQEHWPDQLAVEDFDNLPDSIKRECIETHVIHPWQIFGSSFSDGVVEIIYNPNLYFYQSPVIHDAQTNTLHLHNSDPVKAMEVCYFKICPHFVKGKLYKCGPTAILPEFIDQFDVQILDQDINLIKSYQPAQADWTDEQLEKFLHNQKTAQHVAQCKFCPEKLETGMPLRSGTKKIKFERVAQKIS